MPFPPSRALRSQSGSVLILIVLLVSLLVFIPVGAELLKNSRKKVQLQANAGAQALNVARAGLTDAVAWFRRQPVQPVRGTVYPDDGFYPRLSTGDTLDESIGLVKEYDLGEKNSLFARYEVIRQSTNNVVNPSADNPRAVHDVTGERVENRVNGDGLAWYIESVGYVYRQKNTGVGFDAAPNEIVGRARVATEIRRVTITTPASAAVIITRFRDGRVNSGCQVLGGSGLGAGYYVPGGTNYWGGSRTVGGVSDISTLSAIDQNALFGVSNYELRLMADYTAASMSELPASYPTMALVYINNSATFTSAQQLRGGGILYVNGNLTINSGSNALFSGLIFVNGNCTISGPAYISGVLMVTGTLTMNAGTDTSIVQYDPDIMTSVLQDVGQYRENKSVYHVFSTFK